MSRFKAVSWLLGVALLAVALVAALRLPAPDSSAGANGGGGGAQPASGAPVSGMTIVGTVDAPGGVQAVHPPGVLGVAALRIKKVLVKDGDTVRPGDVLIEFDSSQVAEKVATAKAAVNAAEWLAAKAALGKKNLEVMREEQKLAERKAKEDLDAATKMRDIVKSKLEDLMPKTGLTDEQKAKWRSESVELEQADYAVKKAKLGVDAAAAKGKPLEPNPAESGEAGKPTAVRAQEAEENAAVGQVATAKAQLADAEAAVAAYTLKAEAGGVVEQLTASEGANVGVGPGARVPLMYLVPTGKRVVRAEVEAEFASKLIGFEGKAVTVCDAHNFSNTYPGRAVRMGTAYLPKRFGGDSFAAPSPRVIEFVIEVPDPAPSGKPPLRPGQPVRVVFGP